MVFQTSELHQPSPAFSTIVGGNSPEIEYSVVSTYLEIGRYVPYLHTYILHTLSDGIPSLSGQPTSDT